MAVTSTGTKTFNPLSLDAVNFLLADVRGAFGPFLNVFLVTQQHWSQSQVGVVTTIAGLLGIAVQTPIGGAIDETRSKRGAVVLALAAPDVAPDARSRSRARSLSIASEGMDRTASALSAANTGASRNTARWEKT